MTPTRFVNDSALERLARRLRILGFDVVGSRGSRLLDLFERAAREDRTVLTPSLRRPRAYAAVPTLTVPRSDLDAAAARVLAGFEPSGSPFTRCPLCNASLQRRQPLEALGEVPGRVLRSAKGPISYCPHCGKWFWDGTHVARLREWMGRLGIAAGPDANRSGSESA